MSALSEQQARPRWLSTFGYSFYSSGTVVATGNTGIIATPLVVDGGDAVFPTGWLVVGSAMASDETNTVTIDWYLDAAGSGGSISTTTFDTLTAGAPSDVEPWPGDVVAYNAGRDLTPLFPFHKITHTLAGTTKSMSYIVYLQYLKYSIT